METNQGLLLLSAILKEISLSDGRSATEKFSSLREVDAKAREVKIILDGLENLPPTLITTFENDIDFQANSRRVRLEALAGYVKSAIKFLDTGAFEKPKKSYTRLRISRKLPVQFRG